jgi:AraC family transcriptional regulator
MSRNSSLPEILAQARTADGVAFQLRRDQRGVLEVPGIESVLIGIHVGPPALLSCRRGGRRHTGRAVHGDIDIIPPNTPSRWEMHDQNDTALLLSLPQTLLESVASQSGLDSTKLEIRNRFQVRDSSLEALSWAMKREMELDYPSGRLYLDGLALAVASRVVARHSSVATGTTEANHTLGGRRLKQVLSFIEERLADDISLQQIAEAVGISPSHLSSQFRGSMGIPVHQYLIQRRLERAKSLLSRNGLSIAEIALAAGFAHQSHLARHMRRVMGVSPRAMQRLLMSSSSSH